MMTNKYKAWLAESGHSTHVHGMCHLEAWEAGQAELRAEVTYINSHLESALNSFKAAAQERDELYVGIESLRRELRESKAEVERLRIDNQNLQGDVMDSDHNELVQLRTEIGQTAFVVESSPRSL